MSEQTISEAPEAIQDTAVNVSRSVSHSTKSVWNVLMTTKGAEILLGPGARLGEKGHTWTSDDGRSGVIRSYHPLEQLRFTWRSPGAETASMVDLQLVPEGDHQTTISIKHDHLRSVIDPDEVRQYWENALASIEEDCL